MKNENIVVINTSILYQNKTLQEGVFAYNDTIKEDILSHCITYPRAQAEENFNYKQIISYIMCIYQDSFFVTKRKKHSTENRLSNQFSLGIGGHLRKTDILKNISDWGEREFFEEAKWHGSFCPTPYAYINDNSNDVGKVHLGVAYLLLLDNMNIATKSELKQGIFMSLEEINTDVKRLESWSKLLLNYYLHKKNKL